MKYQSVRGTHDFPPEETNLFNGLVNKSREIFRVFGYEEIILPVLEEEGVFLRAVGETTDIVEKQMFKIQDKEIVLRPEGTAQVVRYFLENGLHKKADFHKLFYVGPMFRGERPQKGRLRQFHHIGAEAIGSDNFYLDGEMITVALKILDAVGLEDRTLKINTLGCSQDKEHFSQKLAMAFLEKRSSLCEDCQRRLDRNPLRVLDCKHEGCKAIVAHFNMGNDHLCGKCKDDFTALCELLKNYKITYTHDPMLVRGLDYYTKTVFEFIAAGLGSQDAVGAGGRYNNLVHSLGGPDIPAIGFALGIERILLSLNEQGSKNSLRVFVATASESLVRYGGQILQILRERGIASDTDYCAKSLKAQLRQAQNRGAKYVVILGEEEWKENCVVLKDMEHSHQEKIPVEALAAKIQGTE